MNEQHGPPQGKPYLLIHDYGEFAEHVLIMGPQFFLVLQLVFLDEAFIYIQGLPTRICKLPLTTARSKLTNSHRDWPLKARLLIDSATRRRLVRWLPGEFKTPHLKDPKEEHSTKKSLPEDFLQKLYLVVRVFLCFGFFKKSSCIGHGPCINLLGRREFAEDEPTSSMEEPAPQLGGVATCAPIVWDPSSLTSP